MESTKINTRPENTNPTRKEAALARIKQHGGAHKYHKDSEAGQLAVRKAAIRAAHGMPQKNDVLERVNSLPIVGKAKKAAAYGAVAVAAGLGTGAIASSFEGKGDQPLAEAVEYSRNAVAENQQANQRAALESGRVQAEALSEADNELVDAVFATPIDRQTFQMGAVYLAPGTEVMNSASEVAFTIQDGSELRVDAGMLTEDGRLVFTMSDPQRPTEPVELLQADFDLTNLDGEGNARYESYTIPDGLPGSIANHTQGSTPNSDVSFSFYNYQGFIRHIENKGPDQIVANAEFYKA